MAPPATSPARVAAGTGPAWIVREVTHVPGVLRLRAGRLSFRSSRRVVFDVALESADLTFPRFRPPGVFHLVVDEERLRVHVVRPPGAVPPAVDLLDRAGCDGVATLGDPTSAACWRRLLDHRPVLSAPAVEPVGEVREWGWRSVRARRAAAAPGLRS